MKTETKWLCIIFGLCHVSLFPQTDAEGQVTAVYQWTNLEYDYPSESARRQAINSKEFVPENGFPIDVDVHYTKNKNKIFVTVPRFQNGIPATLGLITPRSYNGNPVLAPYPSWSWHQNLKRCPRDRIVSVFRVKIDECQRLWIIDDGRMEDQRVCPPQILAFDLKTDQLVHRYEIPGDLLQSNSILVNIVPDVRDPRGSCVDTFVYVADCQAMALIVHDVQRGTSWRIIDKTFYPNPFFGTYNIAGQSFDIMDGLMGLDLSPYKPGQDRILYYHAMSSGSEQWVYTSYIRNQSMFLQDTSPAPEIFHVYSGQRQSQVPGMAIDRNGIAYFGLASDLSMNCWNTAVEYGTNNIGVLAQDNIALQFPSNVKVITNLLDKQELWFITMRFQRVATGTLNFSETNFRVMAGKLDDLLKGSKCLSRPSSSHSHHYGGGYGYGRHSKRETGGIRFPSE
ncbi:hypothetical protein PPYR_13091 [Photinus pyralis]|uniref:Bee-milk protein n=1 Tax=Photinus pyralis TaxID=7054 RepID=A0A1Y1JY39_PHOPY|nr:protein yellow-like isoform X3 [Photinus pyralis]KAB0793471.1 hypothetical protein PPYR_13091 [Photinus pyralis]